MSLWNIPSGLFLLIFGEIILGMFNILLCKPYFSSNFASLFFFKILCWLNLQLFFCPYRALLLYVEGRFMPFARRAISMNAISMYVCMNVCMYVCMYVRTYVRMYVCWLKQFLIKIFTKHFGQVQLPKYQRFFNLFFNWYILLLNCLTWH